MKYHKIDSIFKRDPATKHKTFLMGRFSRPEFEYLRHNEWVGTEKVDGTNIRIEWDGEQVRFGGKTDRAQIPAPLITKLQDLFPADRMKALDGPCTLCGEGYGAGIQKGGKYIPDGVDFILFDAWAGAWLQRETVVEMADTLSIQAVPILCRPPGLAEVVNWLQSKPKSEVAHVHGTIIEGLVLRPTAELNDRMGRRIITKIKVKDFDA